MILDAALAARSPATALKMVCRGWRTLLLATPTHDHDEDVMTSVPMLRWARRLKYPWNETTCARAAESGHLEVLRYARCHEEGSDPQLRSPTAHL